MSTDASTYEQNERRERDAQAVTLFRMLDIVEFYEWIARTGWDEVTCPGCNGRGWFRSVYPANAGDWLTCAACGCRGSLVPRTIVVTDPATGVPRMRAVDTRPRKPKPDAPPDTGAVQRGPA